MVMITIRLGTGGIWIFHQKTCMLEFQGTQTSQSCDYTCLHASSIPLSLTTVWGAITTDPLRHLLSSNLPVKCAVI